MEWIRHMQEIHTFITCVSRQWMCVSIPCVPRAWVCVYMSCISRESHSLEILISRNLFVCVCIHVIYIQRISFSRNLIVCVYMSYISRGSHSLECVYTCHVSQRVSENLKEWMCLRMCPGLLEKVPRCASNPHLVVRVCVCVCVCVFVHVWMSQSDTSTNRQLPYTFVCWCVNMCHKCDAYAHRHAFIYICVLVREFV